MLGTLNCKKKLSSFRTFNIYLVGEVCCCVVCPEVPTGLVFCVEGELWDVGLVCGTVDVEPLLEDGCVVLGRLVEGGLVLEEGTTVLFDVVVVWTGFGLEDIDVGGTFVVVVVAAGWLEEATMEVMTELVGAMEAAVVASPARIQKEF